MQQFDQRNMLVEGSVADILVAAVADTVVAAVARTGTVASSAAVACTVGFAASLSYALAAVAAGMDKVHIHLVLDTETEEAVAQSQLL